MSCCQPRTQTAATTVAPPEGAISFQVDDMTCGHCAGTIKTAIESKLPGTSVDADPASKLVSVRGGADFSALKSIVTAAGYTPGPQLVR